MITHKIHKHKTIGGSTIRCCAGRRIWCLRAIDWPNNFRDIQMRNMNARNFDAHVRTAGDNWTIQNGIQLLHCVYSYNYLRPTKCMHIKLFELPFCALTINAGFNVWFRVAFNGRPAFVISNCGLAPGVFVHNFEFPDGIGAFAAICGCNSRGELSTNLKWIMFTLFLKWKMIEMLLLYVDCARDRLPGVYETIWLVADWLTLWWTMELPCSMVWCICTAKQSCW